MPVTLKKMTACFLVKGTNFKTFFFRKCTKNEGMYQSEMTSLATFPYIRILLYGLNIWRHTSLMPNPLLEN